MNGKDRIVSCSTDVSAPIEKVWQAWTTEAGARAFFAEDARIDARPGGVYELYFNPSAPTGLRGSEGMEILSMQAPEFLSITWNAPPHLKTVREQRTHVTIRLERIAPSVTRVVLKHDGWGTGDEWDAAYAYFERAWETIVLPRLKHSMELGPIDWKNTPLP